MFAFVVFDLVFQYKAKRLVGKNVSEMTLCQSISQRTTAVFSVCADGLMELNAFVQLVSEFRREGDSEEEILEAFRVFDPQFTGVVSVAQFRQVMMNYGERLSENDVDDLVALADVDRKGDIRYMG